jgi:hypothetical protein
MSTRKVVDLEDFSRQLGAWSKASLEKKRKAVASGVAKSIPDLVAASPVDTGLYAASWDFKVSDMSVVLGNYAPYAGIIEYGARPFTPPIGPLLAWAKRVLTGVKGVSTGQPETSYSPEVWRLAKGVQNKIAREGMAPRHMMENEIPQILQNIREELKRV